MRVGLETAEAGTYQRRVGYMRLLGELYAYKIVDSRYGLPPACPRDLQELPLTSNT